MSTHTACQALQSGKRLSLNYDGYDRVVEVHAVGQTKAGPDIMRVWQVSGGARGGETVGWKLMRFDEASGLSVSDEASSAPRSGYKQGDSAMANIICQV